MEHSLDDGDGPPSLQVKPCTPEFYQTHYQLVSRAQQLEEKDWGGRPGDTLVCIVFLSASGIQILALRVTPGVTSLPCPAGVKDAMGCFFLFFNASCGESCCCLLV